MYASQTDMERQIGAEALLLLADRDRDGVVDADVVAAVLTDASAVADAHLSVRYSLPLATVPALLRSAVVDIAHYRLANRPGESTEEMRRRHDDAIALLKRIAEGKADLPGLPLPPAGGDGGDASTSGAAFLEGSGRIFGRHAHRGGGGSFYDGDG